MKGAIAAFVAACAQTREHPGTLSLIITGDEEGPAIHGTRAIMDWMEERAIRPDMILIGEPTSEARLGDVVKIGRRGSVNMWISVPGMQGHVAYPHRADNPVPKLARVIAALDAIVLDEDRLSFQHDDEFVLFVMPVALAGNAARFQADAADAELGEPARRRQLADMPFRHVGGERHGIGGAAGLFDCIQVELGHVHVSAGQADRALLRDRP